MQAVRSRPRQGKPLQASPSKFGWLLEAIPEGVVIEAAGGGIISANGSAEKLLGFRQDEISGRPLESLLAAHYRDEYRRQRAAVLTAEGAAVGRAGLDLRTGGHHGRSFPIELTLTAAEHDGAPVVVHTLRPLTDGNLRERESEALLAATASLGAQAEPEAVLRTLVEQAAALLEAERAHYAVPWEGRIVIRGRWSDGRWRDDDHEPRETGILASVLQSGRPFRSNDVLADPRTNQARARADGLHSQLTVPIMVAHSRPIGFVVLQNSRRPEGFTARDERFMVSVCETSAAILRRAQDTAARLEAERERSRLAAELSRLNEELEQRVIELQVANRELESFSYSISHDLRAPLRSLDGFSRILLEDHASELSEKARRYLHVVRDSAQQMGQLVDDLLAFSRLGRQPLKKQPVDLSVLVRQVVESLAAEQEGRNVEISIGDLPVCEADLSLLRQVFVNLIGNALKFTRHRDPAIIEIGRRHDDEEPGKVVCFVKDNGAGFDMEYADKLFGVFQRLHRAEEYEGTGVGLAIVERIVTRHGGRVWAESEVEHGATFYVALEEEPVSA
jgi:PAS domain S-box-containing protein